MRAKMTKQTKIWDKINKIYVYCSAPEKVAALESIKGKLSHMKTEMRLLVTTVRSDVKNSVVLQAMGSVLKIAEEIKPHMVGLKENQQLVADARLAFDTQVLKSGMNRMISRSTEGVYCLLMGNMFLDGMSVERNYRNRLLSSNSLSITGIAKLFIFLGSSIVVALGW